MKPYSIILTLHIISGFSALIVGLIPMFTAKGGKNHVQSGKVYFWAMFGVFMTSNFMFFMKPDRLLFLFLVGIFSFYQTFSGARILKYKSPSVPIALFDKGVAFVMGLSGITMIGLGIYSLLNGQSGTATVYIIFGSILSLQGIRDFHMYTRNWKTKLEAQPKEWMYRHISRMGGSYIATFTAFVVVNNTFLPSLIGWQAPGVIGGFIIAKVIRKYKVGKKPANV